MFFEINNKDVNEINVEIEQIIITGFSYRGLARDVIHHVTDGRRHIGGIFFAPRGLF
jgi:hypothetical protein